MDTKPSDLNAVDVHQSNHPKRYALHIDGFTWLARLFDNDIAYFEFVVRHIARTAGMHLLNMMSSDIKQDLAKLDLPHFEDEGGFSILGLISTSHIALHAWPARGYFMFDLVSCRPFDVEHVSNTIKTMLGIVEPRHFAVVQP